MMEQAGRILNHENQSQKIRLPEIFGMCTLGLHTIFENNCRLERVLCMWTLEVA